MVEGMKVEILIIVWLVLFIYGIGYNSLVAWIEARRYSEGFVWLMVVLGVLATLGGLAVLNLNAALLALGCFAASGTPMAAGSIWRYWREREKGEDFWLERSGAVLEKELDAKTEAFTLRGDAAR